jgi:predicted kinase
MSDSHEGTALEKSPTATFVVLISGPPAAGKTSLSMEIAEAMAVPLFTKDEIKERLFDTIGWSDVEWSKKLGGATYELLFWIIERCVSSCVSLVMESTFHPEWHRARLHDLMDRYGFRLIEVHCMAEPDVLAERFRRRQRHPGHRDEEIVDTFEEDLAKGAHAALAIGDAMIEVDTTDPDAVDVEALIAKVREAIS